jgi:hypothetical protein
MKSIRDAMRTNAEIEQADRDERRALLARAEGDEAACLGA